MKRRICFLLALCLLLCGCTIEFVPPIYPTAAGTQDSGLIVHFLDVGQADCALLSCDGEFMLIDGGNVDDGRMVVSYLLRQGVSQLKTVICSHAHEDHVGGLSAVLAVFPTQAILSPTTTYASNAFDDFLRYADQQQITIDIPAPGDTCSLGGAVVTVLGPVKSYPETNDTSIVVRVNYGETSFLFTGDMEITAESDMLDHWGTSWQSADVLKVGHHGSDTSTGYRFLYEVSPAYAVISVGEGNSYGHPHEDPLSRLLDAGCTLFRTDQMGTVIAASDGSEITFTWENQAASPNNALPGEEVVQTYIGNAFSRKFHDEDCTSLPGKKNRVYFDSFREAIDAGYTPCGSCLG